jgi:hypothetical protein
MALPMDARRSGCAIYTVQCTSVIQRSDTKSLHWITILVAASPLT